ncbi:MAG TPA: hypothetical protein QF353_01700 [Gammaproteobacteria bacterium]|nr:hypothetical protein [Gammaproteobacteria bacterium]
MAKKLLLTARDYSSGLNAFALVQSSLIREFFDIKVILGYPANELFRKMLCQDDSDIFSEYLEHFEYVKGYKAPLANSIKKIQKLVSNEAPDILITGISGAGIGVDEVAIKVCKGLIPVISYQDYWGYINKNLGCVPDKVLLMDNFAKSITDKNYPHLPSEIVGSLKYDFYLNHVADNLLKKLRRNHSTPDKYWVFVGQPISFIDDYIATIELVIKHAKYSNLPCYYLPHPSVNLYDVRKYLPPSFLLLDEQEIPKEILLLRADKIFTCFSTYVTDLLIMKQLFSLKKPDIAMINISNKIQDYQVSVAGTLSEMPIPEDLVCNVRTEKEIISFLERKSNINASMKFDSALANINTVLHRELMAFA